MKEGTSWYCTESENLLWQGILQSLKFCRNEKLVIKYALPCKRHYEMMCSEPRFGLFSLFSKMWIYGFTCHLKNLALTGLSKASKCFFPLHSYIKLAAHVLQKNKDGRCDDPGIMNLHSSSMKRHIFTTDQQR